MTFNCNRGWNKGKLLQHTLTRARTDDPRPNQSRYVKVARASCLGLAARLRYVGDAGARKNSQAGAPSSREVLIEETYIHSSMARWSTVGVTMVQVESRKWCNCDRDGSCCGQSEAALPPRRGAQAMANLRSARRCPRAFRVGTRRRSG